MLARASHAQALDAAYREFLEACPSYAETHRLDELRASEYGRLDSQGVAYLDYTGAGLYGRTQVERQAAFLAEAVLGNPHSAASSRDPTSELVERARERILDYFHASADTYDVIFTPNASGALRLVAEAYPFAPGADLLLVSDDHNSVQGMREYALAKGARVRYAPVTPPDLRLDGERLAALLDTPTTGGGRHLFAYPAQSNFSGVQHPLGWIERAAERGWDVLLDAAAFVPTNPLDLSRVGPTFVALSFYKMTGLPTGVGALLVRREALARLERPWFAGGTVLFVSVNAFEAEPHAFRRIDGHEGFEDGTLNFLAIPAVEAGLDYLEGVGVEAIHTRVMLLTGWLLDRLLALRHENGRPVVEVYGPHDLVDRGAVVLFNVLDPDGGRIDDRLVQAAATEVGLRLRAGCHCNPGAREAALGKDGAELARLFQTTRGQTSEAFLEAAAAHLDGAVRASLGIASNFEDVFRLVRFVETYRR